jgi:hypothetical protein
MTPPFSLRDSHGCREMLDDAREYLQAAGIANPTREQIVNQIEAEHGSAVAQEVRL